VVIGTSRCPRCHTALPRAYTEASGGRGRWLWLLLAVAVAGGLVYYFARGRSGGEAGRSAPGAGAEPAPAVRPGAPSAAPAGPPAGGEEPARELSPAAALGAMTASLRNRNLEATIEVRADRPDLVQVRSDQCDDRLRRTIAEHAAALRQTGFSRARCSGDDGSGFDLDL